MEVSWHVLGSILHNELQILFVKVMITCTCSVLAGRPVWAPVQSSPSSAKVGVPNTIYQPFVVVLAVTCLDVGL